MKVTPKVLTHLLCSLSSKSCDTCGSPLFISRPPGRPFTRIVRSGNQSSLLMTRPFGVQTDSKRRQLFRLPSFPCMKQGAPRVNPVGVRQVPRFPGMMVTQGVLPLSPPIPGPSMVCRSPLPPPPPSEKSAFKELPFPSSLRRRPPVDASSRFSPSPFGHRRTRYPPSHANSGVPFAALHGSLGTLVFRLSGFLHSKSDRVPFTGHSISLIVPRGHYLSFAGVLPSPFSPSMSSRFCAAQLGHSHHRDQVR